MKYICVAAAVLFATAPVSQGISASSAPSDSAASESADGRGIVAVADVQFNEVYANTLGTDNSAESEYFEIHNRSSTPADISGYTIDIAGAGNLSFVNPPGTIIPPNGYLVYAANKALFLMDFPGFIESLVVDLGWSPAASLLANGNSSNTMSITAPGGGTPFDTITFLGLGETARSQELEDPSLPNDISGNWKQSLTERGSPGRRNTYVNPAGIFISAVERTVQFPTATTPIVINADVTGTNITAVNLHYTTSIGSSYTAVPMAVTSGNTYSVNLGTFPDGTVVKYFVEVLATGGTDHYPPFAAPVAFHINNNPATSDDLVINEAMLNPTGTDNVDASEWIEIYNRRSAPINMSFFKFGYTLQKSPNGRVFPEGTVIPANGYLVFAYNYPKMMEQFPSLATSGATVVDGLYKYGGLMGNAHNLFLSHANVIFWNGLNWQMTGDSLLDSVAYTSSWPFGDNLSMELKHPSLDNASVDNWAQTVAAAGTPGAQNSVYESTTVQDWSVY